MDAAQQEFSVYCVEVCRGCGWNHLVEQFMIGRDGLAESASAAEAVAGGPVS